ncbi:hypothetical protein Y710_02880 [Gordonia sp. QH-12]|uniref:hypothetical protein n=1 Tax=Gordonia sp. QH-12 TaxID=1437876 RepID=UPI000784B33F|nr:hypothetical protein [Gordonia sp. QH-12]KXT58480.1 hypothetical protein Y710_02880 [Gordonia sp. QH-12]
MLRSILSRSALARTTALAAACAGLIGVAGCGDGSAQEPTLPSLLLTSDQLPPDFTAVPMMVNDLIVSNRSTLEQSKTVAFTPPECAPTADAEFNPQLTEDNSALLVARSDTGVFSELLSSVRRDIDVDRRATTGPCAVVTAVPSKGTLAGAHIVTTTVELPALRDSAVEQSFLVRSDSVTTLPGGAVRARAGLMGNILVRRPSGETVTLQLGLSTDERAVSEQERAAVVPGSALVAAPVTDDEFVRLVRDAVTRAAR